MKFGLVIVMLFAALSANAKPLAEISDEYLYGRGIPTAHSATLAQAPDGALLCAYFGGLYEKSADTAIFLQRLLSDGKWTRPEEVANGKFGENLRAAVWNPVLFTDANRVYLFYKIGDSPRTWSGFFKYSDDCGKTWSAQSPLGKDAIGPAKNKPVKLGGKIIMPSSREFHSSFGWTSHFEIWDGKNEPAEAKVPRSIFIGLIQPAVVKLEDGTLAAFMRSRKGFVYSSKSKDGVDWNAPVPTEIPNPNSGLDAAIAPDGSILLVCNPTRKGRNELGIFRSRDGGKTWTAEYLKKSKNSMEYPSIICAKDGKIHIVYSADRRIKHMVLSEK